MDIGYLIDVIKISLKRILICRGIVPRSLCPRMTPAVYEENDLVTYKIAG